MHKTVVKNVFPNKSVCCTILYIITELSLPAWQKEARDITYQGIKAIKEAKKKCDVLHEIFCA